nr:MAG TPA: hypothetical protein [Caudoviricetes sp.]
MASLILTMWVLLPFRTRRCNACKYSIGQGEENINTEKE